MKRSEIFPAAIAHLTRIAAREAEQGRPVPSNNEIARECGFSHATVDRALRQLRADGVISLKRRTTAPAAGFSYRDDDEWDVKLREGSVKLLAAIKLAHPERFAA